MRQSGRLCGQAVLLCVRPKDEIQLRFLKGVDAFRIAAAALRQVPIEIRKPVGRDGEPSAAVSLPVRCASSGNSFAQSTNPPVFKSKTSATVLVSG
jgi:hypothetical protein